MSVLLILFEGLIGRRKPKDSQKIYNKMVKRVEGESRRTGGKGEEVDGSKIVGEILGQKSEREVKQDLFERRSRNQLTGLHLREPALAVSG